MKPLFITLLVVLVLNSNGQTTTAQPTGVKLTPNVQPSAIILNKFSAAYPNISPQWTLNESIYSAEYRDPNTNMGRVVSYDTQGNITSIENELANDAYPTSIGQYYVKKYPGERYSTWSWEDGMGNKMYYILRGEQAVWFSTEGKVIPNTNGKKKTSRQLKYAD